nr:MAG TPA: hypothetical protein [Caudoviricetes sp.]
MNFSLQLSHLYIYSPHSIANFILQFISFFDIIFMCS